MIQQEENKKEKRTAALLTLGVNAAVLLLLIFLIAWKEPNPPIPEYGISLNIGFGNPGSDNIESTNPSTNTESESIEDSAPIESVEEAIEEVAKPTPVPAKQVPTKEVVEAVQKTPSAVKAEEKKVEEKKEEVKEPVKETPKEEVKKVEPPKPNPMGQYGAGGTSGTSSEAAKGGNQGTSTQTGNAGDPKGTVDGKGLYGAGGSSGTDGSSLNMSGWIWDSKPNPKDNISNTNGRIVFEIKIDDKGEVISVRTIEKNVSPAVEQIYKREVEQLTFRKLQSNTKAASQSVGTITFLIKVN
ncbi:energy transducer TonB [Penaeicola halotolerans]|uniref:energy transducer TonB n=1 Tax=Penaeicola halotolerans TaxID=2793196 RepID=UPI001CF88125|nr:energy transducer TonB [Penaeicola halotolerans]